MNLFDWTQPLTSTTKNMGSVFAVFLKAIIIFILLSELCTIMRLVAFYYLHLALCFPVEQFKIMMD